MVTWQNFPLGSDVHHHVHQLHLHLPNSLEDLMLEIILRWNAGLVIQSHMSKFILTQNHSSIMQYCSKHVPTFHIMFLYFFKFCIVLIYHKHKGRGSFFVEIYNKRLCIPRIHFSLYFQCVMEHFLSNNRKLIHH